MKTQSLVSQFKVLTKISNRLRCTHVLYALITLSCAVSHAEDKALAKSHEELFMGQKHPFAQRGPAPVPGAKPEDTAKALYSNEVFFNLRNAFPQPVTDYLSPCFSPGLLQHFAKSRAEIEEWMTRHKGQLLRLLMNEGSIFLSFYEGGTEFAIGPVHVEGDRAEVTINLTYKESGHVYPWQDVAVLIKSSGKWLLMTSDSTRRKAQATPSARALRSPNETMRQSCPHP